MTAGKTFSSPARRRGPVRGALKLIPLLLFLALFLSCASAPKALVDYTLSEGIIWPGPPEKPRIKYLWSLHIVSGSDRLLDVLAGHDAAEADEAMLQRPHGLFVSGDTMYITDPGAFRVSVIDLKTNKSFNIERADRIPLLSPIGIVVDPEGRIYVSDADLARVAVFNAKGKFIRFLGGEFKRPTGLALNTERKLLYVADTWAHTVYVYDLDGGRLRSIGQRGEGMGKMNYPTHIAIDRDGYLYVSDTLNFKVQIFTPTGAFLTEFGLVGDTYDTFDKIKGIAVDTGGHIYVVDSAQDMVKIYDRSGTLLLFFGQKGHFYGDFYLPAGIFIDDNDRIYVSDGLNRRIQAFQFLGGGS